MSEGCRLIVEAQLNALPIIEKTEPLGGDQNEIRRQLQAMVDNLEWPKFSLKSFRESVQRIAAQAVAAKVIASALADALSRLPKPSRFYRHRRTRSMKGK